VIILISKKELEEVAKISGLKLWQQEKHYFQTLILQALKNKNLIFKGGTYLWFFHGLNRFSEDLDFTTMGDVELDLPKQIVSFLKYYGVKSDYLVVSNKKDSYSFRVGIEGPLYDGNPRSKCFVYADISKREKILLPAKNYDVFFAYYNLPVSIITGCALEEVFAEKIRAIMTRNKARDLYDLWFLIKKQITCNVSQINKKLSYCKESFNLDKFFKSIGNHKANYKLELNNLIFGNFPEFEVVEKDIKNYFQEVCK